jgi:hypothetical protein
MAIRAAINTYNRVYSDPSVEGARAIFEAHQSAYDWRWSYYNNSIFDNLGNWNQYKSANRMYRFSRSLYNPAARLADFYVGSVYPGRLSVAKDTKSAIPLNEATPVPLRRAIGQLFQWSNWQENKAVYVRYGAVLGDVLCEVVDDTFRQNVTLQNVWPGLVADLELDPTGNVKMYVIEYDAFDEDDKQFKYRKTVDGNSFKIEHDDKTVEQYDNPYSFVPATWTRHRNEGTDHGAPAMRHTGKWDELNGLASHAHDQVHKIFGAPVVLSGSGSFTNLDVANTTKGGVSEDNLRKQESISVIKGPADAAIHVAALSGEDAIPYMEKLIQEIEHDHPELTFYSQLRDMSQVTGPAASRLMGDVQALLSDAQATYDQQMIKAIQMAVAIGGWRLQQGDWTFRTRQQQAFAGFNLDSYKAGDLDFSIDERDLLPLTELEKMEIEGKKIGLKQAEKELNAPTPQPVMVGR